MNPEIADAATTPALAKYTDELGSPILPLKFLFVDEMLVSPSDNTPICPPKHGPQPGLDTIAPASKNVFMYPKSIAF